MLGPEDPPSAVTSKSSKVGLSDAQNSCKVAPFGSSGVGLIVTVIAKRADSHPLSGTHSKAA